MTLLLALMPQSTLAHEVAADVTIRLIVKPEGQRMHVLVRVPLEALQDIEFPTYGPGYLDISAADEALRNGATIWISDNLDLIEGDTLLSGPTIVAIRASLPSDSTFGSYADAVANLAGPRLPDGTEIPWQQALLDVMFEYRIQSDQSEFAIQPSFERLGLQVLIVLRFLLPDGVDRAFELGGNPGLVRLDPRWHQAFLRFVALGFFHILDGVDHMLFLLCLVIPFRRFRPLLLVITSFTVAHSITLIVSALSYAPDALWFPPLVESLIAMSIIYMALENIVGVSIERRWMITFGFGLIHGFGFSFLLHETLQFAGSHLITSLLAFNVGVEIGQLVALAVMLPVLAFLFRYVVAERVGTIILSVLIGHTAWHWMMERIGTLRQFPAPELNAAFLAGAMRWAMLIVLMGGLMWLVSLGLRRWSAPVDEAGSGG